MKYTEILRLKEMLEKENIPFQFNDNSVPHHPLYQIEVIDPTNVEIRLVSVVQGSWSYGGKEGFLEIMGLLTPKESENDSVVGWLKADEVFNRIKKAYKPKITSKLTKEEHDYCADSVGYLEKINGCVWHIDKDSNYDLVDMVLLRVLPFKYVDFENKKRWYMDELLKLEVIEDD